MNRKGERMKDPLGGRGYTIYYDFMACTQISTQNIWQFGK